MAKRDTHDASKSDDFALQVRLLRVCYAVWTDGMQSFQSEWWMCSHVMTSTLVDARTFMKAAEANQFAIIYSEV